MKGTIFLVLAVLLLGVSIAGCTSAGQDPNVAPTATETPSPEPTATENASEEPSAEIPAMNETAPEEESTPLPVETSVQSTNAPVAAVTVAPSTLTPEEKEFSEWITRSSNLLIPSIDHAVAISNTPYDKLNVTELSESSSYLGGMATYYFDELEHMDYPKKFTSVRNQYRTFLHKTKEGAGYLVMAAEAADDHDRSLFSGYRSPACIVLEEAENYHKLALQYLEEKSASDV